MKEWSSRMMKVTQWSSMKQRNITLYACNIVGNVI